MKKRFTIYAAAEDRPSREEVLKDRIDRVADDIEYALAGIEHLADSRDLAGAESILDTLEPLVSDVIQQVGEVLSGGREE